MVCSRNDSGILPLARDRTVALIGPAVVELSHCPRGGSTLITPDATDRTNHRVRVESLSLRRRVDTGQVLSSTVAFGAIWPSK